MFENLSKQSPKILVVGDFMVDNYIWSTCEKISPEAPVLIAKSLKQEKRLGRAANVYANLANLNAQVFALGVVGDDEAGEFLKRHLKGVILAQKGRKTPLKNRILAHNQQVLGLDEEDSFKISLEDELISNFETLVKDFEAIILNDYGKGVLSEKVCQALICRTNELNIPILIDPKGSDYNKYQNTTLLTPNKKEALETLKFEDLKGENLKLGIKKLKNDFHLKYSIITLSEGGIALFDEDSHLISAEALEVYDVTGARDSVIAILAFCLIRKVPILNACELVNEAAAVVVSKIGSVNVSFDEIKGLNLSTFEKKIKGKDELVSLLSNLKDKKIVFTDDCFDIVHFGHLSYLEQAKKLGDILIVGLNLDASVKRLKGEKRPISKAYERACMLGTFYPVDFVCIFEEGTPLELIKALKPDVLAKGADYEDKEVVGNELVKEVKSLEFQQGFSTTSIIERIRK